MNVALSFGALLLFAFMLRTVFRLAGDSSRDRWWSLLLWILGCAVLLQDRPFGSGLEVFDGTEYLEMARSWVAHHDLAMRFHQMMLPARYDPVFPVVFVAPSLLIFSSYEVAVILPLVLSALLPVLVYCLALCWIPPSAARWCGVGAAFLPIFREWSGTLMIDGIVAVTLISQLLLALHYERSSNPAKRSMIFVVLSFMAAVSFGLRMTNILFSVFLIAAFCIRRPFPRWRAIAASLIWWGGIGGMIAWYRLYTFGTPFRSGYQYWTSVPYDFPALMFSVRYIAVNLQELANTTRIIDLSAIAGLAFLILKSSEKSPNFTYFKRVTSSAALIVIFYAIYFFPSSRFFMPAEVIVFLTAWSMVYRATDRVRLSARIAVASIALVFLFVSKPRARVPGVAEHLNNLSRFVRPGDTLVTSVNPLFAEQRMPGVMIVPISRRVEYASKVVMSNKPTVHGDTPSDPLDHRWSPLFALGGEEIYRVVATEDKFSLHQGPSGYPKAWIDLRFAKANELAIIGKKFTWTESAPGLALLRHRLSSEEIEKTSANPSDDRNR